MHHAYYIEGPLALFDQYKEHLKPLGRSPTGEAFWAKNFERFGIDEARSLAELAGLKNVGEATFFIATASLTTEAQQALLKLFEEPQAGTMFVLLLPRGSLIATLRSRMMPYPRPTHNKQGSTLLGQARSNLAVKKFLAASQKERSAEVAKLLKDEENVRERVREFLDALEAELHPAIKKQEVREGMQDIAKVRSYLGDRSPALKMLLEHLTLSLPTLR